MPTRVEQCPNHDPCSLFRCTRGSHKLLGRHEHAAIQAPTRPRWTPPAVPCCARSLSPTLCWHRLFSAMIHLASAGHLKRGTTKPRSGAPPRHGLDVETLPRWGIPPQGRPDSRPLAVDTAHPAGRKPVRSRQRSLSNLCPHGTEGTSGLSQGLAAASTVKSH